MICRILKSQIDAWMGVEVCDECWEEWCVLFDDGIEFEARAVRKDESELVSGKFHRGVVDVGSFDQSGSACACT